jgi:hypothetical protein
MNNIAVLPYIGLHALQIQNVKRNTTKKVSISELNSNAVESEAKNRLVEGEAVEVETKDVSNTTKINDLPSEINHDNPKNE